LAAAPSIGRASAVEAPPRAREAELTHALYERHSHQLYGFCFAKLGSREEAEDAVQTTFLNAFRALERGVVPQAESAWLFKIAENVCLSRHRSSFRRRRVESPSDLEVLQDVVPAREHEGDELVGLERVLEQMPESQRRAILLREWQGLSYREIADEMELTQAAVETLIFRARRSLAQGLESLEADDEPARRRVRRGVEAGGLIAALKTFLGTAAGMKAAATVVAVGTATVVAAAPPSMRHYLPSRHPAARVKKAQPTVSAQRSSAADLAAATAASATGPTHPPPRPAHLPATPAAQGLAAHRAAPVESVPAPAAPVAATASVPAAVAPAAPVVDPAPRPKPAAQPPTAAPPTSEAPPAPVAPAAQPPAPAKEKDRGKGAPKADSTTAATVPAAAAPSDKSPGKGRGHGKDLQAAPAVQTAPASPATTTSVPAVTPPAATAVDATPAAAPAAAPDTVTTPTPAPVVVEQGHRGRGRGAH
jgi:RNA polymerase sigma factor (sigma-70 family)